MVAHERLENGLAPVLGELDVAVHVAHVVRVADDVDLEGRVGFQELGDLPDGLRRLGLDGGLARVEIDAVDRRVARGPDVVAEGRRVRHDVLLHRFLLDDPQPDLPVPLFDLRPRFPGRP